MRKMGSTLEFRDVWRAKLWYKMSVMLQFSYRKVFTWSLLRNTPCKF